MATNAKKQIFRVYTRSNWLETDNMRLCFVTASQTKLKSFLVKKIKDDTFAYGNPEDSKSKQIKSFKADFESALRDTINQNLHCGYYDYVYDGEEF